MVRMNYKLKLAIESETKPVLAGSTPPNAILKI